MNTELDIYRGAPLAERQQYAMTLARAVDILPKALRKVNPQDPQAAREETAARAFLIMETGDMLGLHPMAALAGVNVIEGKPALSSGLMSAVVREAGHKLHVTEEGTVEGGDYKATAELIREDDPEHPFRSVWTPHRAQRAGLCKYEEGANGVWKVTARSQSGSPLPWESYTESLCKSRAVSEVARDGAQDALLGIRYTPEELESGVEGEVIVAEESEAPAAPAPRRRAAKGTQGTKRKTSTAGSTTPVPMDGPETPQEPQEDIVDAEVVDEPQEDPAEAAEREERARIAAEQEEAARLADAEAARAEREAQVKRQQDRLTEARANAARQEHTARPFVDTHDGATYATQEELDEVIRARVQANRAERAAAEEVPPPADDDAPPADEWPEPEQGASPDAFEVAMAEEPENWVRLANAAGNQRQLKTVWDRATAAQQMTSELRKSIIDLKATLPA